jgi:chromosome segregation protein
MKFFENLWEKWSREETENYIADYERDINNLKKWTELNSSIEKLVPFEAEIIQLEQKKKNILEQNEGFFTCPKCNTELVLSNDELAVYTGNEASISNSISKEKKKSIIDDIDKTIKTLRLKTSSLEHFRKEKTILEDEIDPEEDIDALKNDLKTLKEHLKENLDKEYRNSISEKRKEVLLQQKTLNLDNKEIDDIILYRKKKNSLDQEISILNGYLEDKMKMLGSGFDINSGLGIDLKIQNLERELEDYRNKEYEYNVFLSKKEKWERYKTKVEYQTTKKDQLAEITKKLESSIELRNLVLKTESEIIEYKLKEINELVNSFTENLFLEPMYIDLTTTKPTKEGEKVQINLQITYKNMNDVNLLSGGEKARLNLIFMLAFNIVFKSPLILLDECTSNLDQEMTEQVLEHIENLNLSKVIFIAHQIVEGNFQQIIHI